MPPLEVDLGSGAAGWFTGRDVEAPAVLIGGQGNLSHRRPHRPGDLAAARGAVGMATGTEPRHWHLLHQVHGADVAVVDDGVAVGAELRGFDAAVTGLVERPLVVQTADCVPVLLAAQGGVGVAHAGRAGLLTGVLPAVVEVLRAVVGATPVRAVIGPAIGPCCYEVPAAMRATASAVTPELAATTTWGTPALDLPAAATAQLHAAGVEHVEVRGTCTRCSPTSFSHRRDPASGRQVGLVVRRGPSRDRDAQVGA